MLQSINQYQHLKVNGHPGAGIDCVSIHEVKLALKPALPRIEFYLHPIV
jgi:hypothetical protein